MARPPRVGELFLLGFRGTALPDGVRRFEEDFGLGGLVLFDADVERAGTERNVRDPAQLAGLCAEIHALPSRPLVFVDQEGGHVRRLRPERGFAPLPAAAEIARLPEGERLGILRRSYEEMVGLGIDFNLAPVVDLSTNPRGPGLGALGRCFSDSPEVVCENVTLMSSVAAEAGLGLCLKHYPGLGGATTDTHETPTDLTGLVSDAQLQLFTDLHRSLPGGAILLSHGIVRDWEPGCPVSLSAQAVARLRAEVPDALLVTDDLQMGGVSRLFGTVEACRRAALAGVDLLCVANNRRAEEDEAFQAAEALVAASREEPELAHRLERAGARVRSRKRGDP